MRCVESSDRSLLVIFGEEITLDAHRSVMRMTAALMGVRGVVNLHPGYASILIDFDPFESTHRELTEAAATLFAQAPPLAAEARTIEIPVRYGGEDGPDLGEVAALCGRSPGEIIDIHSGADYLVHFLGFSPGFPYLGGLPESIAVPRLPTPRRSVPAGSVAIGGQQTGVYPIASPGGWRIIGRTQLRLFDPGADPPVLLRMGDHVRFVPVGKGDL